MIVSREQAVINGPADVGNHLRKLLQEGRQPVQGTGAFLDHHP